MNDGVKVGQAHIEIIPKIDAKQAQAKAKKVIGDIAKDMDRALGKGSQKAIDQVRDGMREIEKGRKGALKDINAEITANQKLDKQRQVASRRAMQEFDAQKRRIAESMKAQKALAEQRDAAITAQQKAVEAMGRAEHEAYAMERKRIEAIQKAEIQAYAEADKRRQAEIKDQQRRLAELNRWHEKKRALERADAAEAAKAAKAYMDEQLKRQRYLEARMSGMSARDAASAATGKNVGPREIRNEFMGLNRQIQITGNTWVKTFDRMSHTLSQLSTRIGLASFQLQLLGGFSTMFLTGPAVMGMAAMGREGLKFAVSIDYARASMKALLGPAADVEKIIRDIQRVAIESPLFNTEDAISYAQKLAAVGVQEKDLTKSMQALSNIFLTQGVAGPERASLALMAYTQILSKGMIGMDDLRQQFAEHVPGGIKIFEEVARRLGYKTLEGLRDDFKAGRISAEQLNKAFIELGNSDKYLAGATTAAQTLGATWQGFVEEVQARLGMAFDANRAAIINAINGVRPVFMAFIDEVVAALPVLLHWLGRLIGRAQQLKDQYKALNPEQQDMVKALILFTLASGPAAIAIGIFGTALSGAANAASLFYKSLALVGGGMASLSGWVGAAVIAIGAAIVTIGILYTKSEGMRKAVAKSFNLIKDLISTVLLPAVDILIGSFQSLEKTFGFLGLKSEHLAHVLLLLGIPIGMLVIAIGAVVAVIKAVQVVMLVLASIAYAVTNAIAYLIMGFRELFELIAKIPGAGDWAKPIAESADRSAKKLGGLIDVSAQWKGLTEANSNATSGLQSKMNATDLTVTGLMGAFAGLNSHTDQAVRKQISLEEAINNARNAMEGQASAARSAQDASDNWQKSLLSLKESIKANKQTLNEKTRAGQANRDMLKAAAQASYEMMLQDIRSGVPMEQAIKRHKDRTEALKKEFGKNKETQAAAQKLIDTYGKVPPDVQTLLKTMGYPDVKAKLIEILAGQKVAANPGMDYRKALNAEKKAWALEKREGLKGPGFATGGYIANGPGTTTSDSIPIRVSRKEFIVNADSTQKVGPDVLSYINQHGKLPLPQGFAQGGQVWPVNVDLSKTKFPEFLGGPTGGGGMGWQRMMAVLRQKFPGLPLISGHRPGAVTSTGNRSYHALGRAVDLPPRWDVFNWIAQNYGKSTKELIFTPAGGNQIKNGRPHRFTGGTIAQDHWDHVHWAYDNGGYIKPNQPFINKTGSSELALNSSQGAALEEKIADSDRPLYISVYVDGVRRDAEIVFDEKTDELIRALGGA